MYIISVMNQDSLNNLTLYHPISSAHRYVWVIKDFSKYHDRAILTSPEFNLKFENGLEKVFYFEILDTDDDSDDDSECEDCYKLVFKIDSEIEERKTLEVVYSILNQTGLTILDEQRATMEVLAKDKFSQNLHLLEHYDLKELIFQHGMIIINFCIMDVTLNKSIITDLILKNSNQVKSPISKVAKQFINFYETKDLSDFVLKVEDQEFYVHKFALAAASPVFSVLFLNSAKTNHIDKMEITDSTAAVVQEMLRYIYTGCVHDLNDHAKELLKIAHKYNLDGLVKLCANNLKKKIDINNVLSMLALATKYGLEELQSAAQLFFMTNIKNILQGGEFMEFINSFAYSFESSI